MRQTGFAGNPMRSVLLTGASGAIGSMVARYLLEEEDTKLFVLLRAESQARLDQRLRDLYRFWALGSQEHRAASRVSAIAGDVTLGRLGLTDADYNSVTSEVTHVIHAAGNVKLNRPLDEARRSAVDATHHLLSLVAACQRSGRFEKLEYVSTVGVAGRLRGTVPERRFTEPREFRNSYEAAKAEAEALLLAHMDRGLPATIHRPSMVVGDSRTGQIIQFQVFYHLCEFLAGRRTRGCVPDTGDMQLDIIPVDYVARAIRASTRSGESTGRIFHLCSGPAGAPRIADLMHQVRGIFTAHGRPAPRLRRVPPRLMRRLLPVAERFSPPPLKRTLQSLPFFLAYLDEPQTFANDRTREFFASSGVVPPAVDSYLDTILTFYLAHPDTSRERSAGDNGRAAH
jgi:UDP-glucose 4-epimerase